MGEAPTSAMIFAAGFGTRMGELTRTTPKPMLHVGGQPMIDHAVGFLRDAGVNRIVANTHYLHERIAPHLTTLDVEISHEQGEILDTGGGLKAAQYLLEPGPVITMNPDAAWRGPNPVETLLSGWSHDLEALLLVVPRDHAIARQRPGDFDMSGHTLTRSGDYVYTGLQIIQTRLLEQVSDRVFSLNRVWDALITKNQLVGVPYEGHWCDIGHPGGLAAAEALMSGQDV